MNVFFEKKIFHLTNTYGGSVASPPTQYDSKSIFLEDKWT